MSTYRLSSSKNLPTPLLQRAAEVFGLSPTASKLAPPKERPPAVEPGHVVLFNGPSGGGKSTQMRSLVDMTRRRGWRVTDVAAIRLADRPCVELFGRTSDVDRDLAFAANRLTQVGLGEARVLLTRPGQLSDGQRWRLRLALATTRCMRRPKRSRQNELLVADEFAAVLDRVTACVVARSLRRTVDRLHRVGVPIAAVAATSHDDLRAAMLPDRVVWCEC
jgi:ABC-type ATPase with predicted acetyltransferase domain